VAGLTLGGGYGWLTPRYGLTIDNLLQATIVTSSGTAVTCSNDANQDLFWAIRGGGCNFGVCTEFVFRLHPQRKTVYAGVLFYPGLKEKLEELVKVTTEWWEKGKTEDAAMGQMVRCCRRI
jgi:FAD/FMN-containing dehydrogenase